MRGGHPRSGRVAFDASTRALHGTRERAQHRNRGGSTPMIVCDPPAYLTAAQRTLWEYFAPQLVAEGRLPLKTRDVLAKYVLAVDLVARLNATIFSVVEDGEKHPLLAELRQWLLLTRLYESDLLLNPAAAVRAPTPNQAPGLDEDRELDAILN